MNRRSFFKWLTTSVGSLVGLSSVTSARTRESETQEKLPTVTGPGSVYSHDVNSTLTWTTGNTATVNIRTIRYFNGKEWIVLEPPDWSATS